MTLNRLVSPFVCILVGMILYAGCDDHSIAAQVELEIRKQAGRKMDLAVAPITPRGQDAGPARVFDETLSSDLERSGHFQLVPHRQEILGLSRSEPVESLSLASKWQGLGAQIAVKGGYVWNGNAGTVDVYAFEIAGGRRIFAKRYALQAETARTAAHACANDLIQRLTGERGIAGTRIAYVAGNLAKELFIADSDGRNVRQLTRDGSIILGVSWHPSQNKVLYTSFKDGRARIYIHDFAQGERRIVSRYPGLNAAAKFSPDGSKIALVLSKDGNPEIYVADPQGRILQRVTNHPGVDSSPCWSPDGRRIAYVSDRSGRPHLYIQDLAGGPPKRVTFQGTYNSSPSWSPKGNQIAFSSNMDGNFRICVLDLNDLAITMVSQEGGDADEPDWAPDGRHLIYSSKVAGTHQLYIVDTADGRTTHLSSGRQNHLTPAWSLS